MSFHLHYVTYKEQGLGYDASSHVRRVWQWYAVVGGRISMTVSGRALLLGPGDSVVIPEGVLRHPRAHKKAPSYFLGEFDTTLDLHRIAGRLLPLPSALRNDWSALIDELKNPMPEGGGILAHALFTRLLFGLWRSESRGHSAVIRHPAPRDPQRAEALTDLLDEFMGRRFREPVTRADFVRAFRMSGSQCARVYRRIRGKTLHQKLTDLRITEAKRLLAESTLAVGDVAMEVGFDSFSHFSQAFRKAAGVTPVEFRRTGGRVYPAH